MVHETYYNGYAFRMQKTGSTYRVEIFQAGERIPVLNFISQSFENAQEFYERKLSGLIEASRQSGKK